MARHCLTVDLKNDPKLIAEYCEYHRHVWPEVLQSLREAGIIDAEIYLHGNRLFMILETVEGFSFEEKLKKDAANPKVGEWEELMWKYQQALAGSKPGQKWHPMECVFQLNP
ncbi:MAG TPA: L-rhamnose mutarotase [Bryobacteraceae bacterium]|jgi:L-rhamnose mutarotase|nr:L-rhamnose mutarotase [Bryobacteraceae bacterium]